MKHLVTAVFTDSRKAGEAVAKLNNKTYSKEISLVTKDSNSGKSEIYMVKQNGEEGSAVGAVLGVFIGIIAPFVIGISIPTVLSIGFIVGFISTFLFSGVVGAIVGGIVGYMVDTFIGDNAANKYKSEIGSGDILTAIEVSHEQEQETLRILSFHGASDIEAIH